MKQDPKDFTPSLVLVDCIPVIFFILGSYKMYMIFPYPLFLMGTIVCILAGAMKVIWKFCVVFLHKNIWILNRQLRVFMPIGFLLMLVSMFMNHFQWTLFLSYPAIVFFIIGFICMICMSIFMKKLDGMNVHHNWIEQIVNCIGQACFCIGIWCM